MRKILHIFLSLVIVYASTSSAYAVSSVGGWTATDSLIAGANTTINATKTAGGKVLNSAVTVGASASKVGKYLIKGGGQAALAYAMVELLEEGIDWVLDPANNAVRYTDTSIDNPAKSPFLWWSVRIGSSVTFASHSLAATQSCISVGGGAATFEKQYSETVVTYKCAGLTGPLSIAEIRRIANPHYDPDAPAYGYKYMPIETVAAKVISNAVAGHADSQEAVKATALEGFAAGEHDVALDAAATEAGTENPPDTENPPKPDDPAVPFDPSSIIAAINALKALLSGILSSITGFFDFFQDTPPEKTQKETDVDVEVPPDVKNASEFDVDYVSFGGQCPVMSPFSIDILGASSSMNFDMTPLCNLAVTIRPAIIAIAYFIGLGVIASAIRET